MLGQRSLGRLPSKYLKKGGEQKRSSEKVDAMFSPSLESKNPEKGTKTPTRAGFAGCREQ